MALWGKGDPRWIVEERPDSTNVNNWHWTERDVTNWSTVKLKELFSGLKEETEVGCWHIDEVKKITGEATINNRKGKLIYFYEWDITLHFKGTITGSELEHTGSINIPNLSDENSSEDIDVIVSVKGDSKNAEKLKELVRKNGIRMCREACRIYIKEIKNEYSTGMVLPTKEEQKSKDVPNKNHCKDRKFADGIQNLTVKEKQPANQSICNVAVKLKEEFKTSADELFATLTQEGRLCAFTRSRCTSNPIPGGEFILMDGNICGSYVDLVENEKIVQKWRFKEWSQGIYSTVTIQLHQKSDNTILKLTQTGIPDFDTVRTEEGWKRHFWGPIKQTFGYGNQILS